MEDFVKYVHPGPEDKAWGLYLNCAGTARIPAGSSYPPESHPSAYFFDFENGRYLSEYQVNYITEGSGEYENKNLKKRVLPGTLVMTRPGQWHRYRPGFRTGWREHYVGFAGPLAQHLFAQTLFAQLGPVLEIGKREEIIDSYDKIFTYVREEKPGYQQVAAGMVVKLLGYIVSIEKQKGFSGKPVERTIQHACFRMREGVARPLDFEAFAKENNIGYSYFRKMFKKYTGVSPGQYHLEMKILRAKELLLNSGMSIKEIAYSLGFQSIYYFSRVFKQKQGRAPSEFRKMPVSPEGDDVL